MRGNSATSLRIQHFMPTEHGAAADRCDAKSRNNINNKHDLNAKLFTAFALFCRKPI